MKSGNKGLILALLRVLPRLLLAVGLQAVGVILLDFLSAVLWPEQKWLSGLLVVLYLCWSNWKLSRSIARWSKSQWGW